MDRHTSGASISGDEFDEVFDDDFDNPFGEPLPEDESLLVARDLDDLDTCEQVFAQDGVKGVSMWCHDCDEDNFYRWDLLRNSQQPAGSGAGAGVPQETGEIPVHEPAFQPDPVDYVPWEYAGLHRCAA